MKLDAIAADYDKDLIMDGEFASTKREAVEYAAEAIRRGGE